jgi:NTE family protein
MRKKVQYGLALGGGGLRGAYQAVVARALKEMNIDIVAVSGTSVGAINGALIVQNDVERMADLYRNITFNDIFTYLG